MIARPAHGRSPSRVGRRAARAPSASSVPGLEIYRVMRFSGIKLGAGINQNW